MKIEVMLDHRTVLENRRSTILFAAQLQTPGGQTNADAQGSYVFVIDRSLSMTGGSFNCAKKLVQFLIRHLPPIAQLAIIAFDEEAESILGLNEASDKGAFAAMVDQLETTNAGSNLSAAWLLAREELESAVGPRRILLFTDGEHTAGVRDENILAALAADSAQCGISTSTFCLGVGNEPLLAQLATAGQGRFHKIRGGENFATIAEIELGYLLPTVAQNVRLSLTPSQFCEQIEPLGQNLKVSKRPKFGAIEVCLGDFLEAESRSVCFNLEVQPMPCIDGVACASLEGETLLQIELRYDQITPEGIFLNHWRQDILVQATQPAAEDYAAIPLISRSERRAISKG